MVKIVAAGFACVLMLTATLYALGADYPNGPIKDPWGNFPHGYLNLINHPGRVHGFFVNSRDFFFYAGNTQSFNAFMAKYAGVQDLSHSLVLHIGRQNTRSPWDKMEPSIDFDWKITGYYKTAVNQKRKYFTEVELWLGGLVNLDQLEVPLKVKVHSEGEIESFIWKHEKKRREAKRNELTATTAPSTQPVKTIP